MIKFIILSYLITFTAYASDDNAQLLVLSQQVQNITQQADPLPEKGIKVSINTVETIEANKDLDRSQDALYDFLKRPVTHDSVLKGNDELDITTGVEECRDCKLDSYDKLTQQQPFSFAFSAEYSNGHKKKERELWTTDSQQAVDLYATRMMNAESKQDIDMILEEARTNLSFKDKVTLATKFGGIFSNTYNYDRAAGGDDGTAIKLEQLLEAAKKNDSDLGGVCRDIATAQAQILNAMGVKNTYVISFASPEVAHTTLVTQDPNDPSKIIKINYDDADTSSVNGSAGLSQDTSLPDTGINYYVFDHNGKPITALPSALGTLMEKATGGVSTPFTEGNIKDIKSVRGNLISKEGYKLSVRAFTANLEGESKVYGVVSNQDFNYSTKNTSSHTRVSAGVYNQEIDRDLRDVDAYGFYARIQSDHQYHLYSNDKIKVSAIAMVDGQALGGAGTVKDSKGKIFKDNESIYDGVLRFGLGAHASYKTDKFSVSGTLTQHGIVSGKDVRTYTSLTPVFDYKQLDINSKYKINSDDLTVFTDSVLILDEEFGFRGSNKAGVQYRNTKVSAGYEGTTNTDAPIWVPGTENKAVADVEHKAKIHGAEVNLFLNYSHSDLQDHYSAGFGFRF